MSLLGWLLNPVGSLINTIIPEGTFGDFDSLFRDLTEPTEGLEETVAGVNPANWDGSGWRNLVSSLESLFKKGGNRLKRLWDDYTGKSQIDQQNALDKEMAEYQNELQLQSIKDQYELYKSLGLNTNLMYSRGTAAPSYSAPHLQAYSGSAKIDTALQRIGQILQFLPAMYNSTAALESIDQAREKTKQEEIRTMSMGMNLIDQGYDLGDKQMSRPFAPQISRDWFSDKRHFRDIEGTTTMIPTFWNGRTDMADYTSAQLKHQFDLLKSIGIKNDMNSTLNNWRGYQYELDRRYGNAGRIVGMASQGLGTVANTALGFGKLKLGRDALRLKIPEYKFFR